MAQISGANLIGAYPVFDTSRSIGSYNANLQKQQAQRQAELKELNDSVSKIKIDGLREADKARYFEKFNEWRNEAQSAYKDRDNESKFKKQSNADVKFLELQDFINKSKEYNKLHRDVSGRLLDDRFRNQFTDDAVKVWQQSDRLPIDDPRIIKDPTVLERQIDTSKILGKLNTIENDLLNKSKYNEPVKRPVSIGNKKGTELTYTRSVAPEQQALQYGMLYDTDRDFKAYVQKQYGELYDQMGEDEAKAAAIQDLVSQRPVSKTDKPQVVYNDTTQDNMLMREMLRQRRQDGKEKESPILDRQAWVKEMITGVPGSGERLKAIVSGRGYDEDLKINIQGNKISFVIPPKTTEKLSAKDGKASATISSIPGRTVTIDTNKPGSYYQLNEVLNELTGENIKVSKYATGEASGKRKGDVVSTTPSKSTKMVTMILPNGQSGQIPSDKVEAFLKKNPKAKRQ